MYEIVGEAILPNTFFQNSSASSRKLLMKLFFKKKTTLLGKLSCAKQALIIAFYNDEQWLRMGRIFSISICLERV
jgi:hypothetical protein